MPQQPTYESVLFDQRETMLDNLARALAGIEGRPIGSEDASPDDEDAAWTARDKRVMPEHLAMIAEATVNELRQQTDETGNPQWTDAEIATEVKARQTAAQYPYRHLTYSLGIVDPEEQAAKAERVRKRVERKFGAPVIDLQQGTGWQEAPDDYQPDQGQAPGLGDLMSTGQPQQPAAPVQGQEGY